MDDIITKELKKESIDFLKGVKYGIWMFAWWKDGEQFVGSGSTRLRDITEEIDRLIEHKRKNVSE